MPRPVYSRIAYGHQTGHASEARDLISVASDRLSGQVWLIRILAILLFGALAIGFSLVWWTGRSYRIQA